MKRVSKQHDWITCADRAHLDCGCTLRWRLGCTKTSLPWRDASTVGCYPRANNNVGTSGSAGFREAHRIVPYLCIVCLIATSEIYLRTQDDWLLMLLVDFWVLLASKLNALLSSAGVRAKILSATWLAHTRVQFPGHPAAGLQDCVSRPSSIYCYITFAQDFSFFSHQTPLRSVSLANLPVLRPPAMEGGGNQTWRRRIQSPRHN